MKKGTGGVYDKWNISVGDCDTYTTKKFNFRFDIITSYFV